MKRLFGILTILSVMAVALAAFCTKASADELKMVGVVTKIEMAADGASAVATLKDNKSGQEIPIVVNDQLTLDKFKDHRIVDGDEIRCKYEVQGDKSVSKYFRKTAGC